MGGRGDGAGGGVAEEGTEEEEEVGETSGVGEGPKVLAIICSRVSKFKKMEKQKVGKKGESLYLIDNAQGTHNAQRNLHVITRHHSLPRACHKPLELRSRLAHGLA